MVANESGGSSQVDLLYGHESVSGPASSASAGRSAVGSTSTDGDCSSCCSSGSSADEGGVEGSAGLSTVLTSAPHLSPGDDAGHGGAVDASAAEAETALIRQAVGDGDGAPSDAVCRVAPGSDDECADVRMQPLSHQQPMGSGAQLLAANSAPVSAMAATTCVAKLKSALKRPTHLSHGGQSQSIDRLAAKKHRVKFNEALNTFLECDYVIYVDDDEYDMLCCYDYEAASAASAASAQAADPHDQPKLVSVRAFQLQLPESSVTLVAQTGDPHAEFVDQVTLSPPDGYKDAAAALYAASFCLTSHRLQQADDEEGVVVDDVGCMTDSGAESPADESAPGGGGWPMNQSLGFDEDVDEQHAEADNTPMTAPAAADDQVAPPPVNDDDKAEERPPEARPLNGILKGGKYWRGAAAAAAAAASTSGPSGASGDGPKSSAVRFISINGTDPSDPDYRMTICAAGQGDDDAGDQGGTSGTGHPAGGRGSHSAFQQLFPRARKLLEQQQQLHSLPQAHHHHPTMVEHHQERYTEFRAASSTPSAGIGRNAHSEQELKSIRSMESADCDGQSEEMLLLEALRLSHGGSASGGAASNEMVNQGFNNEELNDDMVLMDMHNNLHNLNVHHAATSTHEQIRKAALAAAELAVIRRTSGRSVEIKQRRNDGDRATDSLVERLKWLTTTDEDPQGAEASAEEVREAADGTSDTHSDSTLNAMDASAYNPQHKVPIPVAIPVVPAQIRPILRSNVMVEATAVPATVESGDSSQPAAGSSGKSGKSSEKSSTYRKLNDLFFRSGKSSKEKQPKAVASSSSGAELQAQQSWKSSTSSINRSFSPPPPAEVEPSKLKPTASNKKLHMVHFVGLPKGLHGHAPQAAAASGPNETLGRIPNVVPTVDHIYRSAVDLVVARTVKEASADGSAGDSYSLDDIDAALGHPADASAAGAGSAVYYLHATRVGSHLAEELREEAGGSRSSGSSGDSGLGSHDTSMVNGGSDSGDTAADSSNDELQAFVQQDQGRIDRLKKRYNPSATSAAEDGEAEDYGFLRRPSVRGIKPRFGSTSEIIQQMQAQLAPPQLVSKAASGSHMTWPYPGTDPQQSHPSQHVQALLDPRCSTAEKRRAAMTTSVHLPALHEDVYYQGHTPANIGVPVMVPSSRPASVMNIYGSTGDLYQHLHAQPQRPLIPSSSSAGPHHPHLLERTSSVSSVASVDANALYGTIRRAPYPPQPIYGTYNPAAAQHQPIHPHQIQQQQPLRQSISNPMGGTLPANYRPMTQVAQVVPAQRPPDYQQLTYPAAVRQSPYGVPCTTAPGVGPVAPLIDPRYRQVLPMMAPHQQPQVVLRPTQVDPRLAAPVPAYQPPPQPPQPSASAAKDEREGPEGASSSPGLTGDVNM